MICEVIAIGCDYALGVVEKIGVAIIFSRLTNFRVMIIFMMQAL